MVGLRGFGKFIGKIYSCGGKINYGEQPEAAAVREAKEESGVSLTSGQVRLFERNGEFIHYYAILSSIPSISGPDWSSQNEVMDVDNILGCKTVNRWAFVNVHLLNSHFRNHPRDSTPFSHLFIRMITDCP